MMKSAKQGLPCAQAILGACYYDGEGVPKDPAKGEKWVQKAANQGFEPALRFQKEYNEDEK